jgi:hypothetical protein
VLRQHGLRIEPDVLRNQFFAVLRHQGEDLLRENSV